MSVSINFPSYLPLSTVKDDQTGRRVLTRPFKIIVDGDMITVPEGFDTDLSSYPALARAIVRFDRVDTAGVVHDYLYRRGIVSRREADRIWRKIAMFGEHSANGVQGWVSWAGLRMFGWWGWTKARLKEKRL